MSRLFNVSSYRDVARLTVAFMLAAVAFSFVVGNIIAYLIDQPADWKHFIFNIGMPLIMTPMAVIPLALMNFRLNVLRREMHALARTDSLTELMNRRAFFDTGARALRESTDGAAVMMIDVDHFKSFNDMYGHDAGDAVLRTIAGTIASVAAERGLAPDVHLARIGGEEFALLVTGIRRELAGGLAEAMCAQVRASHCIHHGLDLQATISVGVALGTRADTVEQLLRAADSAVYEAKRAGRDRWCMATPAGIASGRGVSQALRAGPRAA